MSGRVVVPGSASGPLLRFTKPISFWGGIDPATGLVSDPRHPEHGFSITGSVLWVPSAIGSSSSSAIMLELLREGTAPAAVVMGRADAILALGAIVAGELGYPTIPILEVDPGAMAAFEEGALLDVTNSTLRRAGT